MPTHSSASRSALRDAGLAIARIVLGVVFAAHGYQKLFQFGLAGTTDSFRGMGAPLPEISAPVVAVLELVGGVLLVLGALSTIVGLLLAVDMLVAAFLVHIGQGVFIDQGGWELVGALGAGALLIAAVGPGRFAVDALFGGTGRRKRSAAAAAS